MQTKTTKNGTEYLAEPLGAEELSALADRHEEGLIDVCVGVSLSDVAMTDYEGFLDMLEREVVRDYAATLMDICHSTVDVDAETGEVIVRVTADFDLL